MTDPASQFDPSAPLPRRHKRDVGGGRAGAGNPSAQPGPASPPVRWSRRLAPAIPRGVWPLVHRINRIYRGRVWRRRWIIALLAAVVLVLLGLGVTAIWLRYSGGTIPTDSESVAAKGQEAGSASSPTKGGSPNFEAAEAHNADSKPSETEDSDAEAKDPEPDSAEAQEADSETRDTEDGGPAADLARPDLSPLRQKVLPALVTLYRGHGRGTGFVIEGGLVVTAYHVASPGQEATVVFQDGERAAVVEYVTFDAARDLAVLRTSTKKERQPLKLAACLPATGRKSPRSSPAAVNFKAP